MVELKTEAEIDAMQAAGAVVAEALRAVVAHAAPGRSTRDLDRVAADVLALHGAGSPFAIATPARKAGYGMLADYGGHGIGPTMHEDPHVPNVGAVPGP
jgi:methionine aminopeptidase